MSKYVVDGQTMTDIADAVREKRLHNNQMTTSEIPDEIRAIKSGLGQDINSFVREDEEWTRPDDWPDLDSIVIPDGFDGVYMTYDLSKTRGYGWIGVYCRTENVNSPNKFFAERGHLENGNFIVDYSVEVPASQYYYRASLDEANGMVQLWRIRSDDHIVRCALATNSAVNNDCLENNLQPMVERRGVLPYVTDMSSSNGSNASYITMGTVWLERDNLLPGGVVTNMNLMYYRCYRLAEVNLNWNTSHWYVRSMNGMFSECPRLRSVDFSTWDTKNWQINGSLGDMFRWCMTLKTIDLSNWDTSNWTVPNISSMFNSCMSVEEINLSGLDTSNWVVSSLAGVFGYCVNLKRIKGIESLDTTKWIPNSISAMFISDLSIEKLDLSAWDTSNWAVTNMNGFVNNCYSLRVLDISTWDTSNWAVTNLANTFRYCYVLSELDLSKWNTSKWAITTLEGCFADCFALKELDLSGWDTSNWAVTASGFRYTFQNMYAVKRIDLSGWNTSQWVLADTRQVFYQDYSLESIPGLDGFDTSNWVVTYIGSFFFRCYSLENVDLSRWDTTNWAVQDCGNFFAQCNKLTDDCGIGNWDISNWHLTSLSSIFGGTRSARIIDLSRWNPERFALNSVYAMFSECYNTDEIIFPETLSLEAATNASYVVFGMPPVLKECNFYKIKNSNMSVSGWNCLSRESLLALFNKLQQTATTRTLTIGKVNKLKMSPEEIAIATQKGWTVA